jgi:hypothetical protein
LLQDIPNKGDFKKQNFVIEILGLSNFITLMNLMEKIIELCEFVRDKKDEDRHGRIRPHYKLDSILSNEIPKHFLKNKIRQLTAI